MTSTLPLRRFAATLAVLVLSAFGALVPAWSASAHDSLVDASPGSGETVTELTEVKLVFSGTLLSIGEDQRSAAIQVVRDGRHFEEACPTLVDDTASVAVEAGVSGEYEVLWQVVSSDGHTVSGTYTFDYEPADDGGASAGTETSVCGDATDGAAAAAQPSDDSILIFAAAGIGGVAVIGVVVAILLGRRRHDFPEGDGTPADTDASEDPSPGDPGRDGSGTRDDG